MQTGRFDPRRTRQDEEAQRPAAACGKKEENSGRDFFPHITEQIL